MLLASRRLAAREHETACMSSDSFRDRLPGQDEGPPLRFPYQLAVSAVQTEYRPVPGLERPALAQTGTLHSCIAGPVLTSEAACLRPISPLSFGASSTSTLTLSMRPSNSGTIRAC